MDTYWKRSGVHEIINSRYCSQNQNSAAVFLKPVTVARLFHNFILSPVYAMTSSRRLQRDPFVQLYTTYLDVRTKDQSQVKGTKKIVFRIYVHQENDRLYEVRFQISNDEELDFLYESTYDSQRFDKMKADQHLELDFSDFPNVVRQQIIALLREADVPGSERRYKVLWTEIPEIPEIDEEEDADDDGFLVIYERLEFSRPPIFSLRFTPCPIERSEAISQARYNEVTALLKALETEYRDAYRRVQRTAPNLLRGLKTDSDSAV
jgi:hypothetical protein